MRKLNLLLTIFFVLCLCFLPAQAETRQYLLGDIDGFVYNGVGSVDNVYVDPAWQNGSDWYHWFSKVPFDTIGPSQIVLFSFAYDLAPNEQVANATLTLGLRNTVSGTVNTFYVDNDGGKWRTGFYDSHLNWGIIPDTGTTTCSVDLATIGYDGNLLPVLQGGLFSAAVMGDVAVDYAQLTLEVVPEPATFLLLGAGAFLLRKFKANKKVYRASKLKGNSKNGKTYLA